MVEKFFTSCKRGFLCGAAARGGAWAAARTVKRYPIGRELPFAFSYNLVFTLSEPRGLAKMNQLICSLLGYMDLVRETGSFCRIERKRFGPQREKTCSKMREGRPNSPLMLHLPILDAVLTVSPKS